MLLEAAFLCSGKQRDLWGCGNHLVVYWRCQYILWQCIIANWIDHGSCMLSFFLLFMRNGLDQLSAKAIVLTLRNKTQSCHLNAVSHLVRVVDLKLDSKFPKHSLDFSWLSHCLDFISRKAVSECILLCTSHRKWKNVHISVHVSLHSPDILRIKFAIVELELGRVVARSYHFQAFLTPGADHLWDDFSDCKLLISRFKHIIIVSNDDTVIWCHSN